MFLSFSRDVCTLPLALCPFSLLLSFPLSCPLCPLLSTRGGQGWVEVTPYAANRFNKEPFFFSNSSMDRELQKKKTNPNFLLFCFFFLLNPTVYSFLTETGMDAMTKIPNLGNLSFSFHSLSLFFFIPFFFSFSFLLFFFSPLFPPSFFFFSVLFHFFVFFHFFICSSFSPWCVNYFFIFSMINCILSVFYSFCFPSISVTPSNLFFSRNLCQ